MVGSHSKWRCSLLLAGGLAATILVGVPTGGGLAQSKAADGDQRFARDRPRNSADGKAVRAEPRRRNFDHTIGRIPPEGGVCELAPPCPSWCQLDFRSNTCFEAQQAKPP